MLHNGINLCIYHALIMLHMLYYCMGYNDKNDENGANYA